MTVRASLFAAMLVAAPLLCGFKPAAFISGIWQGDANYDIEGKFSDGTMTARRRAAV